MSEAGDLYPGTWAERTPEKPAVIMAESGEVMTYRELDDFSNRLSQLFRSAGLRPGDHVAFCLENRLEYLAVMWGAHYAGLFYTAVSSRLTADELEYIIVDSGSRAFITSPYKAEAVAASAVAGVAEGAPSSAGAAAIALAVVRRRKTATASRG